MSKIKLVAVDIGGTLLNDDNTISQLNKDIFEKLNRIGIKIVLVTARMYSSTKYISNNVHADYGVFGNGSNIIDLNDNNVIFLSKIKDKYKKDLIDYGKINNLYIHFSCLFEEGSDEDNYFYKKHKILNEKLAQPLKSNITMVEDIYSYLIGNDKLINLIYVSENELDSIYEEIMRKFPKIYITEYHKNCEESTINKTLNYIELSGSKTTKANGLDILCKYLNIHKDEVLVIGNDINDIEMFKTYSNSGCMCNGNNEAKKYATYISTKTNDESGVCDVIKHFIKGV